MRFRPRWSGVVMLVILAGVLALNRLGCLGRRKAPETGLYGLMVVRYEDGKSAGTSATWFDVNQPEEAARLREEHARLKKLGVECYVAKGVIKRMLHPDPDPARVNAHR
ncbi:hypothetical protein ACYOEI_24785 [Singulisphaera rosea]